MSATSAEIFLPVGVTLFVALLALNAQRRRDNENHRREKLEAVGKLAASIEAQLTDVHTGLPMPRSVRIGLQPKPSMTAGLPPRSELRELTLLAQLWFPALSGEILSFVSAIYDYRSSITAQISALTDERPR